MALDEDGWLSLVPCLAAARALQAYWRDGQECLKFNVIFSMKEKKKGGKNGKELSLVAGGSHL